MSHIIFIYPGDIEGRTLDHVAAAGRVVNLSQAIARSGYRIEIMSFAREEDDAKIGEISGIPFRSIYIEPPSNKLRAFMGNGKKVIEHLKLIIRSTDIRMIILYGTSMMYSKPLAKLCKNLNLPFVSSINEWGQFQKGKLLSFLIQRLGQRFTVRGADGLILITTWMMNKCQELNAQSKKVLVPGIFDLNEFPSSRSTTLPSNEIMVGYTGSIHNRKDSLVELILAFAKLPEDKRERLRLVIAGSTYDDVERVLHQEGHSDTLDEINERITYWGFLPRSILRQRMEQLSFTVLFRPVKKYSMAGFPTKFAESMALGIPMICNLTSDIGIYAKDHEHIIQVDDPSIPAITHGLEKILAMSDQDHMKMKQACRELAETSFSYEAYSDRLKSFIEELHD